MPRAIPVLNAIVFMPVRTLFSKPAPVYKAYSYYRLKGFIMTSHTRDFYIGDVAKLTGVKIETIRYYEKAGVLTQPDRGPNGYRLYTGKQIERLMFIKRCRALGFSLSQTLSLLDLANSEGRTCRQVSEKAEKQLAAVRSKMKDLKRMEDVLVAYVDACPRDASTNCPIVTALSDMPVV